MAAMLSYPTSKDMNAGTAPGPLAIRKTTTVVIVEGDASIRKGWMHILECWPGYRIAGEYKNGEEAFELLPHNRPNFVLMDMNLPRMSGIECTRKLRRILSDTEVLMFTMFEDQDQIFQALKAGASGYFLKHVRPVDLKAALDEMQSGGALMTPHIARLVVKYFQSLISTQKAKGESGVYDLSFEENEIMKLRSRGYQYTKIATDLHISLDTVNESIRRTYQKLHMRSGTAAIA